LQLASGAAASAGVSAPFARAVAAGTDAATIGWPNDVPSWDPNQRFTPDAQPIFKVVFDQPLDQDSQLKLIPHLIKSWILAPGGSFMDYAMPRAGDLPNFAFSTHNVPATSNPLGVKGSGEAGAVGAPPAVINAIVDALHRRAGVRHIDMPATPRRVWEMLNSVH
jgi:hypothetical protein